MIELDAARLGAAGELLPRLVERGVGSRRRRARDQTRLPASFSSRKSVRAASRTTSMCSSSSCDERQKQRAVETVLVEVVGRARSRSRPRTTPSSNRRVNSRPRIIASAMSVTWNSSKQSSQRLLGDRAATSRIGSSLVDLADLQRVAKLAHALVHVGHEFVEMRPPLALHRRGLEEQVHQHGLAAADIALDVQALDRLPALAARRTASRARTISSPA